MPGDTVSIVRQYQAQQLGANNRLETYIVIDFNVGDDGPFTVKIPAASFTSDLARAEIQKVALEVAALRNY